MIDAYLQTFADKPHAARLWFEYWIALSRRGATQPLRRDLSKIRALLVELLAAVDQTDPEATADTLLSWLLGAAVQESISPASPTRRHAIQSLLAW